MNTIVEMVTKNYMCFRSNTVIFLKRAKFSPKRQIFDTIVRSLKARFEKGRVKYLSLRFLKRALHIPSFFFICPTQAENAYPKNVTKIEANELFIILYFKIPKYERL